MSSYEDFTRVISDDPEPLRFDYEPAMLIDIGAQIGEESPYYALRIVADADPGVYFVQKLLGAGVRMPLNLSDYRLSGSTVVLSGSGKPRFPVANYDHGLLLSPTVASDNLYRLDDAPKNLRAVHGTIAVEATYDAAETAYSLVIQPPAVAIGGLRQLLVRQNLPY